MAYSKQTWTDDVSAVTGARMTHIEQGIYDNSLATDKINPDGTATTSAEIEEGQINDVIGFKSLKLKGQTSQYTTNGYNKLAVNTGSDGVTLVNNEYYITNVNQCNVVKTGVTLTANTAYYLKFKLLSRPTTSTTFTAYLDGTHETTLDFANINSAGNYNLNEVYTKTITPSANTALTIIQYGNSNGEKFQFQLWLTTDNTKNTFEPFTNGASPNPDFPQDVNNVSGDNVITIGNVNLSEKWETGDINAYTGIESANTSVLRNTNYIHYDTSLTYRLSVNGAKPNNSVSLRFYNKNKEYIGYAQLNIGGGSNFSITVSTSVSDTTPKYFRIRMATTVATTSDNIMVTTKSDLSYIAHQGNNFEINLGKNLFNKDDSSLIFSGFPNGATNKLQSNANAKTAFIPCQPNKIYTISKTISARYIIADTSSDTIVADINVTMKATTANVASHTITTSANAKYLLVFYYLSSADTLSEEEIRDSIQIEKGAIATSYAPYFPPIEICKIGTYQDYIFKRDGKWFKHKEVGKVVWNGTESWQNNAGISTTYVIARPSDLAQANNNVFYNYFSTVADLSVATEGARIGSSINLKNPSTADLASFKTWLGTNNVEMYYQSTTPTDEEITYAPLLRQLDELYNSGLYDVTNISQDNSSEVFILDFEACKNNINGIVEYIRR